MTSLATAVLVEQRKLLTQRLWWILLLGIAVAGIALAGFLVLAVGSSPVSPLTFGPREEVQVVMNLAGALGYVVPLALGVLVYSGDLARRTLALTLLGEPRRLVVFGAKVAVAAGFGAVAGIAAAVGGIVGTVAGFAATQSPALQHWGDAVVTLFPIVPTFMLWAVLGVGLGALVQSPTAAIVGVLVVTQLAEPTVRIAAGSLGDAGWTAVLPGAAHDAALGGTLVTMAMGGDPPSMAVGFLTLMTYTAALLVSGGGRAARYELQ